MTGEPHVFSTQRSASGMSVLVCSSCGKLGVTEPDAAAAGSDLVKQGMLSALLADVQHEIDVVWQARLGSKDYGSFDLLSTRLTELRNVRKYLKQRLSEVM